MSWKSSIDTLALYMLREITMVLHTLCTNFVQLRMEDTYEDILLHGFMITQESMKYRCIETVYGNTKKYVVSYIWYLSYEYVALLDHDQRMYFNQLEHQCLSMLMHCPSRIRKLRTSYEV